MQITPSTLVNRPISGTNIPHFNIMECRGRAPPNGGVVDTTIKTRRATESGVGDGW